MATEPTITVAICTYNRADYLKICLDSIAKQTLHAAAYKVMVVDNNSSDHTREVVSLLQNTMPIQYDYEEKQGLSHARNRAIHRVKTPWLLYIDDEVVLPADYLEKLYSILTHTNYACVGGPVNPLTNGQGSSWADRYFQYKSHFGEQRMTLTNECLSGANFAFRSSWLRKTGGFPADLGMKGVEIGYAEDDFMQMTLRDQGGTVGYYPDLVVRHYIIPEKRQLIWHLRSAFRRGFFVQKVSPVSLFRALMGVARTTIALFFKHLPLNLWLLQKRDYHWQNFLTDTLSPFLYSLGRIKSLISS